MLVDGAATDEHGQAREEQQQGLGDVDVEDGQQRPQATADGGEQHQHRGHKRAACSCSSPLNSAAADGPDVEDAPAARKRPRLLACPGSSASLPPHAAPLDAGTSPGSPGADTEQGGESSCSPPVPSLLVLPPEVLELVLSKLDAYSLAVMPRCCKAFRVLDKASHLRVTEKVARDQVLERCGPAHSQRWRKHSWLERLRFEEVATMFDRKRAEAAGFSFVTSASGTLSVKLDGIGPKLLVSDMCTADCPLLRWRLELKGNNAVEFGVVPVAVQEQPKALHKCLPVDGDQRPVGFSSSITVGSLLPMKVPLMKGSVVEVLARSDRVEFIVTNPPNGTEMTWQNNITVPKPYKGPREFRFEQDYHSTGPVKLAVTAWARAAFDVLHIKT